MGAASELAQDPDARALLTRLGVGTAVVLALCAGTLFVCRRWLRRLPGPDGGSTRMALVETLPLGNRCLLHLVRVGRQQVLVGLDGGGLKSVVALPEAFDEALAVAQGEPAAEGPQPIPTGQALAALVGPAKPAAAIRVTRRPTSLVAIAGRRWGSPSAQRNLICTFHRTIKPFSPGPLRNAPTYSASAAADLVPRYPITGTVGCCARAASGQTAAPPRAAINSRRRRQILICPSRTRERYRGRIA